MSLHVPGDGATQGLISTREFAMMKRGTVVINTARGKLIDEQALLQALEQGRLAGAALDVFATEPEVNARFRALPNVVLTPHIGSNTLRTRNLMAEQCADRILNIFFHNLLEE